MHASAFRFLLAGHDTIEICEYLRPGPDCQIDFMELGLLKEELRQSKRREPKIIQLGGIDFLLRPYGSSNGFPFVIDNRDYMIEFGEFNDPSFRVKYRSQALWQKGIAALHQAFIAWAQAIGFVVARPESISRVDFTFDYELAEPDFDENSMVSMATKDNKYRDSGKLNGLVFGKGDVVLRIYDKVLEIQQESHKEWFFQLWGQSENVWRIEWQTRQKHLRRFGIRTIADLLDQQGDLLRYLAEHHDTLRIQCDDSNRSRWSLHPLWLDLQERIRQFACQGVWREIDEKEAIEERMMRLAISVYGYLKRVAAVRCMQRGEDFMSMPIAKDELFDLLRRVHDPLSWKVDVQNRIRLMQLGQW